jgi:hypothetical protein
MKNMIIALLAVRGLIGVRNRRANDDMLPEN